MQAFAFLRNQAEMQCRVPCHGLGRLARIFADRSHIRGHCSQKSAWQYRSTNMQKQIYWNVGENSIAQINAVKRSQVGYLRYVSNET